MKLLGEPQGLVVFSGQRLWPQLDALAQWGDHLQEVCLVPAHGDDEPRGPAERLEGFIAHHLPDVALKRQEPINDDDPTAALSAIADCTSPGKQWLVDVSGGTRLMFAGGVLAANELDHVDVIYRDADGPWYQIESQGRARLLDGVDRRAVDRFTVEGLLGVTWADSDREPRVVSGHVEPEINEAAARALSRPRDWRRIFDRGVSQLVRRTRQDPRTGLLFERFVLSMVRQMGVAADDIAVGVTLFDGTQKIQEVDVVVNSNGWLHVIDCKLTHPRSRDPRVKEAPLSTQIREAFTTKRLLGDGGDQFIFLRPNLVMSEEFRSLCREYGLIVVDKPALACDPLPQVLERLLRPPSRG